ncbi:MAG: translation initiation factor eIF-1A [Candidatus Aenigmarchaeota archaeon]|nr:translation initiation factor eIF-1A [Candidatus Aenigmarchaeota archaeon]
MYKKREEGENGVIRVKMPKNDETIAVVTAMLGGGRLEAKCEDGFTRICRIPGKIKKRLWIRPGYLILVKPWSVQKEERADVVWLYSKAQADWLKRKGYVKNIDPEL